nr:MAG TPA: hypothetical protein [Caudoviricetes sp.]
MHEPRRGFTPPPGSLKFRAVSADTPHPCICEKKSPMRTPKGAHHAGKSKVGRQHDQAYDQG